MKENRWLVDEFRTRDPEIAARALERHLAHNEQLAAAALSESLDLVPLSKADV